MLTADQATKLYHMIAIRMGKKEPELLSLLHEPIYKAGPTANSYALVDDTLIYDDATPAQIGRVLNSLRAEKELTVLIDRALEQKPPDHKRVVAWGNKHLGPGICIGINTWTKALTLDVGCLQIYCAGEIQKGVGR